MPSLNDDRWDDESFFRAITDEEAEEQLRDPKRWSYIVRDPTGAVCCWGRGRSRKACEKAAIANAEIHAIERWAAAGAEEVEPWPECKCWRSDGWRFVIWPPSEKPGHSRFEVDGTNAEKVARSIEEEREQRAPAESGKGL